MKSQVCAIEFFSTKAGHTACLYRSGSKRAPDLYREYKMTPDRIIRLCRVMTHLSKTHPNRVWDRKHYACWALLDRKPPFLGYFTQENIR